MSRFKYLKTAFRSLLDAGALWLELRPYSAHIRHLSGMVALSDYVGEPSVIVVDTRSKEVTWMKRSLLVKSTVWRANFDPGVRRELEAGLDALGAPLKPGHVRVLVIRESGAQFVDVDPMRLR